MSLWARAEGITSLISQTSRLHSGHLAAQVTWHPGSPRLAASLQKECTKEGALGKAFSCDAYGEDMKPGLERSRLHLTTPFHVV